jgi:hypothetical protein
VAGSTRIILEEIQARGSAFTGGRYEFANSSQGLIQRNSPSNFDRAQEPSGEIDADDIDYRPHPASAPANPGRTGSGVKNRLERTTMRMWIRLYARDFADPPGGSQL